MSTSAYSKTFATSTKMSYYKPGQSLRVLDLRDPRGPRGGGRGNECRAESPEGRGTGAPLG